MAKRETVRMMRSWTEGQCYILQRVQRLDYMRVMRTHSVALVGVEQRAIQEALRFCYRRLSPNTCTDAEVSVALDLSTRTDAS